MKFQSIIVAAIVFGLARVGFSQVVPFFAGGAVASDPIIAVATDGVELNVGRANVTADRRYVTMDLNPQMTSVGAFRTFTFQSGGNGFVGGAGAVGGGGAKPAPTLAGHPKPATLTPSINTSPAAIGATATASVLDKPGMTLVAAAKS